MRCRLSPPFVLNVLHVEKLFSRVPKSLARLLGGDLRKGKRRGLWPAELPLDRSAYRAPRGPGRGGTGVVRAVRACSGDRILRWRSVDRGAPARPSRQDRMEVRRATTGRVRNPPRPIHRLWRARGGVFHPKLRATTFRGDAPRGSPRSVMTALPHRQSVPSVAPRPAWSPTKAKALPGDQRGLQRRLDPSSRDRRGEKGKT